MHAIELFDKKTFCLGLRNQNIIKLVAVQKRKGTIFCNRFSKIPTRGYRLRVK